MDRHVCVWTDNTKTYLMKNVGMRVKTGFRVSRFHSGTVEDSVREGCDAVSLAR